jgi:hypothetical protein
VQIHDPNETLHPQRVRALLDTVIVSGASSVAGLRAMKPRLVCRTSQNSLLNCW